MIQRCTNTRNPKFADYGGRGVSVCDRWRASFDAFMSDMGPRPSPIHSLDRIDNNSGYGPENCRWATRGVQARNTRIVSSINAPLASWLLREGFTLAETGRYFGVSRQAIHQALTTQGLVAKSDQRKRVALIKSSMTLMVDRMVKEAIDAFPPGIESTKAQAEAKRKPSNVVYFIQYGNTKRVKIGTAENVVKRMSALRTSSPGDYRLLATIPGDDVVEAEMHRRFSKYWLRREWFKLEGKLAAYIASIRVPEAKKLKK